MSDWRFKLFYDGQCPFCRREIAWLLDRDRHGRLVGEDISEPEFDPGRYGLTRKEVESGLHGIRADGTILKRMEAVREAYRVIGRGWIAAPTGWPLLRPIFDALYRGFARNRITLGGWLGRGCPDHRCDVPPPEKPGNEKKK